MNHIDTFRDLWVPFGTDPNNFVASIARQLADIPPQGIMPEEKSNSRQVTLSKIITGGELVVRRINFE